jgi:hypothetical protein
VILGHFAHFSKSDIYQFQTFPSSCFAPHEFTTLVGNT